MKFCAVFLVLTSAVSAFFHPNTFSLSQLIRNLENGQINRIVIENDLKKASITDKLGHTDKINVDPSVASSLIKKAIENNVDVGYTETFHFPDWLSQSIFTIPLFLFGWNIFQRMSPDFNQYEVIDTGNSTFQDWGGSKEVLREVKETIHFFINPHGSVKKPKGILLEGPPGTGKTLLGRIMANYANSTFVAFSASNFIELYAGMGALRVRKLFEYARQNSPCIIFIDEIDAIGQKRKNSPVGNEEREQTLNQLLYAMDGFQQNDNILVVAATNRKDILDDALLRPGRFDKVIHIPLPDKPSRLDIIKIFTKNKEVEKGIDWGFFATQTEGFSGADIEQWLNDAVMFSLRTNDTTITQGALSYTLEKLQIGVKKETDLRSDLMKKRVAIHEIGHALICLCHPDYFMIQKVSIQETHNGVGGYTMYNMIPDFAESNMITKDLLMKQIQLLLGGRVAESLFYGDDYVSIGAYDDLQKANELSRQMISDFGLGLKTNNIVSSDDDIVSERLLNIMDQETMALMKIAVAETRKLIEKHRQFIDRLADELVFDITIEAHEVEKLWKTYNKK